MHAAVDALLYQPGAHAVQLLALVDPGGELMAPIGHTLHGTVDALLD